MELILITWRSSVIEGDLQLPPEGWQLWPRRGCFPKEGHLKRSPSQLEGYNRIRTHKGLRSVNYKAILVFTLLEMIKAHLVLRNGNSQ